MFNYTSFEIGLLTLLISFCAFTIIGRICQCIEHCATARAVGKLNMQGVNIKQKDLEKFVNEQTNRNS